MQTDVRWRSPPSCRTVRCYFVGSAVRRPFLISVDERLKFLGFVTVEEGQVEDRCVRFQLVDIGRISFSRDLPVHNVGIRG